MQDENVHNIIFSHVYTVQTSLYNRVASNTFFKQELWGHSTAPKERGSFTDSSSLCWDSHQHPPITTRPQVAHSSTENIFVPVDDDRGNIL